MSPILRPIKLPKITKYSVMVMAGGTIVCTQILTRHGNGWRNYRLYPDPDNTPNLTNDDGAEANEINPDQVRLLVLTERQAL
jgi:hypothetical protein